MQAPEGDSTEALLAGRYRLIECVGEGGMGRVYCADDVVLGRTVAVKVVRDGTDALSHSARARTEMAALASLNHPSLVTLFDAHIVPGGEAFLVMEFVDGPTLTQRLRDGALAPREVAQLAMELAEGLHVAHTAGIVHRDIKPSNVLFAATAMPGRAYRAKLADFGIAHLLDGATRVTDPGVVIGTAAYLAPEQLRGAAPAAPADIYALALVLLEALTGHRAYPDAAGVGEVVARLTTPPTIPDSVGAEWTELLTRMTDFSADERPTALEVATAAADLLASGGAAPRKAILPPAATMPLTLAFPAPDPSTATDASDLPTEADASETARMFETRVLSTSETPPAPPAVASPHRSRRRRRVIAGTAAAAAASALALGVWATGVLGGGSDAGTTVPAVTEPSSSPTPGVGTGESEEGTEVEPVVLPDSEPEGGTGTSGETTPSTGDQAPPDGGQVPTQGDGDGATVDDAAKREAEKAQRQAEQAAEKAQREAEKQAEAERRAQEAANPGVGTGNGKKSTGDE